MTGDGADPDGGDRRGGGAVRPLAAYYSHHKCATMYVSGILERLCLESGLSFVSYADAGDYARDRAAGVRDGAVDVLSYINARWEDVSELGPVPAFHVIRDPRDVLVSAYFSHLNTHRIAGWPALESHRKRLRSVDKDRGLFLEMEFSAGVFDDMASWDYETDHVLELTFEEMVRRPYATFLLAFEHLGLLDEEPFGLRRQALHAARGLWNQVAERAGRWCPRWRRARIPGGRILSVVYDNRFSRKAEGRSRGEEDRTSHYRRGEPGDWRRHLTDRHLDAFRERFPDLLERTGYEPLEPRIHARA